MVAAHGDALRALQDLDAPAAPTRGTLGRDAGLQKADEKSYVAGLKTQQAHLTSEIRGITRTTPKVKYSYTQAINGIAVELTREQYAQLMAEARAATS